MTRFVHKLVGTALGSGYSPVAPGTAGSLFSLCLIYILYPSSTYWFLAVILILFAAGVYSGGILEAEWGKDPSRVVIDEVVGMAISLLFLPKNLLYFFVSFVLFRLFDILKPPPVNLSQKLKGGWGIMMDDVLAGLLALAGVHLFRLLI